MDSLTLRRLTPTDAPLLQQIARQTFCETFAANNSEQHLHQYLTDSFALDKLQTELQTSGSTFYAAELAGRVVGYLKANTGAAQTEPQAADALEIERIYVLREWHGQHVGQALYEQALALARQARAPYVWLGVWEENPRAIRFYQKNGFVEFGRHVFQLGDDTQTDLLLKLPLPTGR